MPLSVPKLSLRYLQKRGHLFDWLRFADAVDCCFSGAGNRDINRWVMLLWRDPASFCFQVLRTTGGQTRAVGFVFGGFALWRGAPMVLLNGVYLRRPNRAARLAIVRAIERAFCAPLGVEAVGIAAIFGGAGPLPPDYVPDVRRIRRLRALHIRGRPERRIYDDLTRCVNSTCDARLHYEDLGVSGP